METVSSWSGCRVLVTGGSGFLGSHLCQRLSELKGEIHATSRTNRLREENGVVWWQNDLTDLATVRELFSVVKPEVVYHLSGLVGASPNVELVLPTFQSLLASTINLLTVVTELGCRRVILIASLTEPLPSLAEATPASPYAAAKWASSGYGRMFHALYGCPVVIVRPYMAYGPGQDRRKLIPSVILSLLKGESPKLSSGQWQADWIYIDDVIDGFLAAANVPKVEGCTIDLGSGVLVSVRSVVEELAQLMGTHIKPMFSAFPDRPLEAVRAANILESHTKLGWKASTPLEVGLKRTIEWYGAS